MSGNSMGRKEMRLLPTWTSPLRSAYGSQTIRRNFQKRNLGDGQCQTHENERKNSKVIWVPGHSHEIADALSRSPVFDQKDEEEEDEETEEIDTAVKYCKQASGTFLISQIINEIDGPYKASTILG